MSSQRLKNGVLSSAQTAKLDRLIERARAVKGIGAAIPVDRLSSPAQQYLVSKGISFTVDRMDRPHIYYSQNQRAADLRAKISKRSSTK